MAAAALADEDLGMSLAIVHSRALDGLLAPEVRAEVANGLPSFTLVGLANTEVKEAREWVRAALATSGFAFPSNIELHRESGAGRSALAASEQIDAAALDRHEFVGELSLAGELSPVGGALAMALALSRSGSARQPVLPVDSAGEAALAPSLRPLAALHLMEVVESLLPGELAQPLPVANALVAESAL